MEHVRDHPQWRCSDTFIEALAEISAFHKKILAVNKIYK